MRPKIVAGNWKMNKTLDEAMEFAVTIGEHREEIPSHVKVIVAPPSLYLASLEMLDNLAFDLAAQNCNHHDYGAFTGEISAAMLHAMRIPYCIVGHSERRHYYHEYDEIIATKVDSCLRNKVNPIFCCGENLEERNAHKHFITVMHQLEKGLFHLDKEQMHHVVVAYEPVWAIGTGVTATIDQAQEMHAFIRETLMQHFGHSISDIVPILYGGSLKPSNGKDLFACPDVDGGLIGGASLHTKDFLQLIEAASQFA